MKAYLKAVVVVSDMISTTCTYLDVTQNLSKNSSFAREDNRFF